MRSVAPSALALLVPWVGANNHDPAMPADDPALAADLLHTRLDLQRVLLWRRAIPGADRFELSGAARLSTAVPLLVAVDDASAGQVIGAKFHDDPVIGQDPDVVHPHLPADVGQDLVPVVKLHPEEGIRE